MKRRDFISIMSFLPFLKPSKALSQFIQQSKELPITEKMPLFFVGHQDFDKKPHLTPFTQNLQTMGKSVKPTAILVISAHWLTLGDTFMNIDTSFHTPEYPSVGAPDLAHNVFDNLPEIKGAERELDHGAWSVLRHLSPDAKVPILEMSIDMEKPIDYHYRLAQQLRFLRERGVLIVGSGNVVHNLEMSALRVWTKKPYDWAIEFDDWVKTKVNTRDFSSLFSLQGMEKITRYAVPTYDHYLPFLYTIAMCDPNENIRYTYEEVTRGLSFRCIRIG